MAIMPHCVVCPFGPDPPVAGFVEFADYCAGWREPTSSTGAPVIGWSNDLGVTAPPGVGLFCEQHLRQAKRLRHLTSTEAVALMQAGRAPGFLRGLFRRKP